MRSNLAILIPHYNNILGLEESISSINEQKKVDLVIVDDGSVSRPILSNIITNKSIENIELIYLEKNMGIEQALNKGLHYIQNEGYKYIGRLDCGDICKENKFTKQMEYLNANKDVFLLGTWVNIINNKGELLFELKHPIKYNEIKKKMYLNSTFVHPTVVFRSEILTKVGSYPTEYEAAEDYAFFFEIIKKYKAENYPEILLDYVNEPNSISSTKRKSQVKNRIRIILKHFYFGYYPVYGLLRNTILYFLSRKTTTFFKEILFKKNEHLEVKKNL